VQDAIRIGIADDDAFMRVFLSRSLARSPEFHVVAAVGDGFAAVRLAQSGRIDVLLLDLEMPGMSGAVALEKVRALAPQVRVVIHSSLPEASKAADMIRSGATAYLEKPCTPDRMAQAIRHAHRLRHACEAVAKRE
jgi:DNA-binding NarL/FixJ family response regulator